MDTIYPEIRGNGGVVAAWMVVIKTCAKVMKRHWLTSPASVKTAVNEHAIHGLEAYNMTSMLMYFVVIYVNAWL